jgi:hypothetical protein
LTEYNTPKGEFNEAVFPGLIAELEDLRANFTGKNSIAQIPLQDRPARRQSAFLAQETLVLAWVLTLPACFFLGATIFAGMLYLFFNVLGWK